MAPRRIGRLCSYAVNGQKGAGDVGVVGPRRHPRNVIGHEMSSVEVALHTTPIGLSLGVPDSLPVLGVSTASALPVRLDAVHALALRGGLKVLFEWPQPDRQTTPLLSSTVVSTVCISFHEWRES